MKALISISNRVDLERLNVEDVMGIINLSQLPSKGDHIALNGDFLLVEAVALYPKEANVEHDALIILKDESIE